MSHHLQIVPSRLRKDDRVSERQPVAAPARIVWKDQKGTTRMANVITRNVSERGVLVDCLSGGTIPLYRLVDLYLERGPKERSDLPAPLQQPHMLAAVYRIGPYSQATGAPESYALRLLVPPGGKSRAADRTASHRAEARAAVCQSLTA